MLKDNYRDQSKGRPPAETLKLNCSLGILGQSWIVEMTGDHCKHVNIRLLDQEE